MTKRLTISEQSRLNELERAIEGTKGAFIECGKALEEIRDSKLYLRNYDTFERYCRERWGWERAHAYRMISAKNVVKPFNDKGDVSPIGDIVTNEGQARELAKVPAKKRAAVVRQAAKSGPLTAKHLAAAAALIGDLAPPLDKDGYPIPEPAMHSWNRRDEMIELVRCIAEVRTVFRKLDPEDPMLVEVNLQSVLADLDSAHRTFQQAVPQHVCGSCQGQMPKTCALCKGRGVVSDFRWLTVPQEVKKMRATTTLRKAKKK